MTDQKRKDRAESEEIVVFKAYSRVCFIAFAGTIFSLVLFLLALSQNTRALEQDFRHDVAMRTLSLHHKIEVLEQFWEDVQSFYMSSQEVQAEEFRFFASAALKQNALMSVAWLPVDNGPLSEDTIYVVARDADRTRHFKDLLLNDASVLEFIEKAKASAGLSVAAMPIAAGHQEEGEEGKKGRQIVVAVPTYKGNIQKSQERRAGGILMTFVNADSFFSTVFQDRQGSNISIFLNGAGVDPSLMYEHVADKGIMPETLKQFRDKNTALSVERAVPLASYSLEITAVPSFAYMSRSVGWSPWIALLLGIVLTLSMAFWFYQQISRNIAIQKIVGEKTRALASSEKHMRAILDNTVDGIITIDVNGIVQTYNPACERIFGYTAGEAVGRDVNMLMPEPYRHEHHTYIANYIETGEAKIIGIGREVTGRRKDGSVFPMELSIGEIKNNSQRAFVGIIRDITAHKEAEHVREKLAAIVESSDDAIISKDLDGTITSWNRGAEDLYGYSAGEAVGQNIRMVLPPDRIEEENRIIAALKDGKTVDHFETVRVTKEGELRDIAATISPLKDSQGNIVGASQVARDITERKKAEARLKEYTQELKRSNQELDDFVYIVSHDLKEPLRGLYSYSQFLQEDYGDKLDEDAQDKLNTLKKLAGRMEELIDTLLYYSRLGRSDLAFRDTDLNEVLQQTLDLVKPVADENNARITIRDKLPVIRCDKVRVGEIFRNLIVNGIKYNDNEEKHIEIGCITDHEDYPGRNVFYVADDGIGIDEKHKDVVFKMFKRLHGRNAYGGGTGSGLAFVKKIVDRHGGEIWIESNKGAGSTFYFILEE